MDSAPKENPVRISMAFSISCVFAAEPGAKICLIIKYKAPNPNTANPATPIPITEPPVKETFRALESDVFAASAVLTLALVAIFIPMNPARAERIAPKTNARPILQCEFALLAPIKASNTATITTKYIIILYSALRKAMAPSAMCPLISFILSLPAFCLLTQLLWIKV